MAGNAVQSSRIGAVLRKEFASYFLSPVAFIFLGVFLVVSMFVFFWVEGFFARNIVDVRPLFEWMPVLLIFLVAALTMRMWSEERRMGTIEFLLTTPVKTYQLVLGKFLACEALVAVALALTIFVPIAVSFMGPLDWGPVFCGYLGALLLAGAYIAIGLFVSAKTDNQIVSLIVTIVICAVLYFVGSQAIAPYLGNELVEVFRLLGTGSRFESIGRGIIDLRDLYYYLSIIVVFMTLNVLALEAFKWSGHEQGRRHRLLSTAALLLALNVVVANFWLQHVHTLRLDLTEQVLHDLCGDQEHARAAQ